MIFDKKKLDTYPKKIGVYLMKDKSNNILYIGKAKNLKKRISQYFSKSGDSRIQISFLKTQISDIDTIIVQNEREALLLENNLIKKHKPKYNILLKDDKTYISLMLTKEKWPVLKIIRKKFSKKDKTDMYFGPYTNGFKARQMLDIIYRLFPLRQCSKANFSNRKRPCLLYEIKRCLAPCVDKCTEEEYGEIVKYVGNVLKGRDKSVISSMRKKMKIFSDNMEYEKAQKYLNMIKNLEHLKEIQHVENISIFDCDAIGFYQKDNITIITKLLFREKRLIGSEHYNFTFTLGEKTSLLESFLYQHYQTNIFSSKNILLPFDLKNKKEIEEILFAKTKVKFKFFTPKKGEKLSLIKMAVENAKAIHMKDYKHNLSYDKLMLEMQKCLRLQKAPYKIICIDTSHISETNRVSSLVTFINGKYEKKALRLYNIKTEKKGDIAAIEEVLTRYLSKVKKENNFPDLILVDGGKAQLNVAMKVLKALDIATIDVISIVKEKAKHTKGILKEKIFIKGAKEPLSIPTKSPLLFFIQKIRDTAHEKAITFHKRKRSKKISLSILDDIPNIGKIKKNILLKEFKSISNIKKASKNDLLKIEKLSKKDVDAIYDFFS